MKDFQATNEATSTLNTVQYISSLFEKFYFFPVFQIRSRIYVLGLLDPDPEFICTDPDPSINKQKNEENLDFYVLFCDF